MSAASSPEVPNRLPADTGHFHGTSRKVKIPGDWDREDCIAGNNGSSFTSAQDVATKTNPGIGPRTDRNPFGTTRNKRSVWTVGTQAFSEAHFATFPEDLIKPCILAGCPAGGIVLDPFFGSGTTGLVARANGCKCIGIELNPEYIKIAEKRLRQEVLEFA